MHSETICTIRTAERTDAPTIYAIHVASLTTLCITHYPLDTLQRWMARKTAEGYIGAIDNQEMFVAEIGVNAAGFGHAISGEVVAIFVHPDFVQQGVGRALLRHALAVAQVGHAGPIKLIATLNAVPFYQKHGFVAASRYALQRGDIAFPVVEMALNPDANKDETRSP